MEPLEPLQITATVLRNAHYLPAAVRYVLRLNLGRYVGAEWSERGWFIDAENLCLADSAAAWRARYAGPTPPATA